MFQAERDLQDHVCQRSKPLGPSVYISLDYEKEHVTNPT